jgi:hypothetical protein
MQWKDRALTTLVGVALACAIPVSAAFLGGLLLTAKTGTPPVGIWWSEVPAIGAGIIAVLCQAMIGYRAAADARMPVPLRAGLGLLWLFGFTAFCIGLPVYLVAASIKKGIPDAVVWITSNGIAGYATVGIMLAIVAAIEIVLPGAMIAVAYEHQSEQAVARAAAGLNDGQAAILQVLSGYHVPLTKKQIRDELPIELTTGQVNNHVNRLVDLGKIVREGSGRGAVFELNRGDASG